MTEFVVERLPRRAYAVRLHEGGDVRFHTSCVVAPRGRALVVKLMHASGGGRLDLHAWRAAAAAHFPRCEWLVYWRKQPDGSLRPARVRLRPPAASWAARYRRAAARALRGYFGMP